MTIHPILAAWDRLFQALDEADQAITDPTEQEDHQ